MRAADTNVVLRVLLRDDPQQTQQAEHFIEKGAWVASLALAETIWVLESVYARSPRQLADAVEMLLAHDRLVLQEEGAVRAAWKLFRAKPALGFSDCLLLELARKSGYLPLGTFDRDLAKLPGAQRL